MAALREFSASRLLCGCWGYALSRVPLITINQMEEEGNCLITEIKKKTFETTSKTPAMKTGRLAMQTESHISIAGRTFKNHLMYCNRKWYSLTECIITLQQTVGTATGLLLPWVRDVVNPLKLTTPNIGYYAKFGSLGQMLCTYRVPKNEGAEAHPLWVLGVWSTLKHTCSQDGLLCQIWPL